MIQRDPPLDHIDLFSVVMNQASLSDNPVDKSEFGRWEQKGQVAAEGIMSVFQALSLAPLFH